MCVWGGGGKDRIADLAPQFEAGFIDRGQSKIDENTRAWCIWAKIMRFLKY